MPNEWLRRGTATAFVVLFVALAVVLLFSDRVGSIVGPLKEIVVDTGRSVEQRYNVDIADRDDIPGTADQIGHAVLWGSGMLLVGWSLRRRVPVAITALFVAGVSVLFEFAQPLLSATRRVEPTDAVANFVGIVVATGLLIGALSALRAVRGDDREYFDERVH